MQWGTPTQHLHACRFGEEEGRSAEMQAQALLVTLPLDMFQAEAAQGKKRRRVNAIYAVAVQSALGL